MEDTIIAISSALGDGAISIIRLSGNRAISIVNNYFSKDIINVDSHTIHYGFIKDVEVIDEVLVSVMKAPKTYTTEDIVEVYCHGGYAVTNKVFETLLKSEARIAEAGEFTKRAFLNGRIDLLQAEAVSDLIKSKTDMSMKLAVNNLKKGVSKQVESLRKSVLDLIANIEVNIDYPEYDDVEELTTNIIAPRIENINIELEKLLGSVKEGQVINDGLDMAIIGSPNVGKSSLLNYLVDEEKAIVTDIAGTTRDTISSSIIIGGVLFNIIDTAGIRETEDVIESLGIKKSLEYMASSDLVLFVIDVNKGLTNEEIRLLDVVKDKPHIIVLNKVDLDDNLEFDFSDFRTIKLSVKDEINMSELEVLVKDVVGLSDMSFRDQTYLTKSRHVSHLNNALKSVQDIKSGIALGIEVDMLSVDINNIYFELGSILGENATDDILDKLFSEFCLGK